MFWIWSGWWNTFCRQAFPCSTTKKEGYINAQLFSQATDIPFPYPHHKILLQSKYCLAQLAWISKQVTVALQQSLIKFQYNYRCMYDFYSGKNSSSFFKHAKDTVTWECVLATEGFEEVREGFTHQLTFCNSASETPHILTYSWILWTECKTAMIQVTANVYVFGLKMYTSQPITALLESKAELWLAKRRTFSCQNCARSGTLPVAINYCKFTFSLVLMQ